MEKKITSTPWLTTEAAFKRFIISSGDIRVCKTFGDDTDDTNENNAKAIVTAVNNTYGSGIRPDTIPELIAAVEDFMRFEKALDVMNDMLATPEPFFRILYTLKSALEKSKI